MSLRVTTVALQSGAALQVEAVDGEFRKFRSVSNQPTSDKRSIGTLYSAKALYQQMRISATGLQSCISVNFESDFC